jgi:hypothetical protein
MVICAQNFDEEIIREIQAIYVVGLVPEPDGD